MKNADQPAFPCDIPTSLEPDETGYYQFVRGVGVTKREYFAAMAMQGLLSTGGRLIGIPDAAITIADKLLILLDQVNPANTNTESTLDN